MTYLQEIEYCRGSKDYKMTLDGRCVGFRSTYSQADRALSEMVYAMLTHGDPPPPEPNPLGDEEGDEAPEWQATPLLIDVLNVITMALGSTHGAASVVIELRRVKARLEAAAA